MLDLNVPQRCTGSSDICTIGSYFLSRRMASVNEEYDISPKLINFYAGCHVKFIAVDLTTLWGQNLLSTQS